MGLHKPTTGLLICACLWLFVGAMPVALAQDRAEEESLLKAAFIYNFAKFTRWPDDAGAGQGVPLTLCIAGEDDVAEVLARLSGRMVRGRPLGIRTIGNDQVPVACKMLYVAASEGKHQLDLIKSSRAQPILTISELPGFAPSGGDIELYRDKEQVRFIINLGAVRRAGLEISPNLLKLAVALDKD